jgi:hypothetical protein
MYCKPFPAIYIFPQFTSFLLGPLKVQKRSFTVHASNMSNNRSAKYISHQLQRSGKLRVWDKTAKDNLEDGNHMENMQQYFNGNSPFPLDVSPDT